MLEFDEDMIPLGDALRDLDEERWDIAYRLALDDVRLALTPNASGAPASMIGPRGLRSARTLLGQEFGETPWLVDGLITEGGVVVIGGEPKSAKSWVLMELGIALATDTPVFGEYGVHGQGRGVYLFQPEDNERSVKKRLRSIMAAREAPALADWEDRLWTFPMGSLDITDPAQLAAWVASIRLAGVPPVFVGLDPLRNLHLANEDNSTEMQPVIRALQALRTVLGCTVAFVHHTGKATADSGARRGGQRLRGSSALHGAIDAGFYMMAPEKHSPDDGPVRYSATIESEVKAAKSAGHFGLDLVIEDDERGDAITAKWQIRKAADATEAKAKAQTEGLRARVLTVVGRYARQRGGAPISQRQIKVETGVGGTRMQVLRSCLEALVDDGELIMEMGGHGGSLYRLAKQEQPAALPEIPKIPEPPPWIDDGPDDIDEYT